MDQLIISEKFYLLISVSKGACQCDWLSVKQSSNISVVIHGESPGRGHSVCTALSMPRAKVQTRGGLGVRLGELIMKLVKLVHNWREFSSIKPLTKCDHPFGKIKFNVADIHVEWGNDRCFERSEIFPLGEPVKGQCDNLEFTTYFLKLLASYKEQLWNKFFLNSETSIVFKKAF